MLLSWPHLDLFPTPIKLEARPLFLSRAVAPDSIRLFPPMVLAGSHVELFPTPRRFEPLPLFLRSTVAPDPIAAEGLEHGSLAIGSLGRLPFISIDKGLEAIRSWKLRTHPGEVEVLVKSKWRGALSFAPWEHCAEPGWLVPKCCTSGYTCVFANGHWARCQPLGGRTRSFLAVHHALFQHNMSPVQKSVETWSSTRESNSEL